MSLLSDLLSPFEKVKNAVEALVPQSLLQSYGKYAHTIVANLVHDAESAVKAGVGVAVPMTQQLVSQVITAVETEAMNAAPGILSGKVKFGDAVASAVSNLKSEAVTSLIPALKNVGETTLKTIISTATSTAIATIASSPPLPSVVQPVVSSAA